MRYPGLGTGLAHGGRSLSKVKARLPASTLFLKTLHRDGAEVLQRAAFFRPDGAGFGGVFAGAAVEEVALARAAVEEVADGAGDVVHFLPRVVQAQADPHQAGEAGVVVAFGLAGELLDFLRADAEQAHDVRVRAEAAVPQADAPLVPERGGQEAVRNRSESEGMEPEDSSSATRSTRCMG